MLRGTRVEISLSAIESNLRAIRAGIGDGVNILLPVKADAYGHGAVAVANAVQKSGLADQFGVSSPMEAIELRRAGIILPILNLGLILPRREVIESLFEYSITQTVADPGLARAIDAIGAEKGEKLAVHLKIDTGMGRIGCTPEEAPSLARAIADMKNLRLEGIFTHFPVSDDPDSSFTRKQIDRFREIISRLERESISIPIRHMANSAAILNYRDSLFTMVRPGIMAYGYLPSPDCNHSIPLHPSMTFKSCIVFVKRVPAGTLLSYGLTYRTEMDSNIATIPVGYADGYNRLLSNRAFVLIEGRRYPVVGRVSMDQTLVNLGDDRHEPGTEVVLFGSGEITAETIAEWCGTIPYEVTCGISKRVPRLYHHA